MGALAETEAKNAMLAEYVRDIESEALKIANRFP
jgi:hypothetical protein